MAWLEAHSENFFVDGGPLLRLLEGLRVTYPLSFHGVGLGLGNTDPIDRRHLARLKALVDRFAPSLVSEHLAWSAVGGRFANDLLPMPFTDEALRHFAARVSMVQDTLGRQILIENVSSYLQFEDAALTEWQFLVELAAESGCGVLLDVNNVYVNAANHDFDPVHYLEAIPRHIVKEVHLAGHQSFPHGVRELCIDTHDAAIAAPVWDLYRHAIGRFGPVPTLIEWDAEIPALAQLLAEAARADAMILAGVP